MRLFGYTIVAILLVWTAASAVTQVRPGKRAVVRRLGRVLEDKPGPGLFIGLPWGLDQVERERVGHWRGVLIGQGSRPSEDDVATPAGQLLTGDHNLVNVQAEIFYTVVDDDVAHYVLHKERAESLVARAAESVLVEWIAGRSVDEVLIRGKTLLPGYLVQHAQKRLESYGLGLRIEEASITKLYPPEEVKDAFDRLAQAQTNIRTQVNKAEQEANKKRQEAQSEIFERQRQTASYGRTQSLQAQADAENFTRRLEQYRKLVERDPKYLNALWQDEMTRLYARMRETGRIDVLDHYLTSEGLNITQFPLLPKKK